MILRVFSDASYLSVSKSRPRTASNFYMSSSMPSDTAEGAIKPSVTPKLTPDLDPPPPWNGAVQVLCHILPHVVASAIEAEIGTVFKNCQACLSMRTALQEIGHPQPPTPVEVDNQCTVGILTDIVKQKWSKSMNMRFFWARNRIRQGQFFIYWRPGKNNRADYFTKHHAPLHHKKMRSIYLVNLIRNWTNYHRLRKTISRLGTVIMFVARIC